MDIRKIAIRCKSEEHGKKIIAFFEKKLGKACNPWGCVGSSIDSIYSIDTSGCISNTSFTYTPSHYTVISLPEDDELTFPREMMVWDASKEWAKKRTVLAIVSGREFKVITSRASFRHAMEVVEPRVVTMADIVEVFGKNIVLEK